MISILLQTVQHCTSRHLKSTLVIIAVSVATFITLELIFTANDELTGKGTVNILKVIYETKKNASAPVYWNTVSDIPKINEHFENKEAKRTENAKREENGDREDKKGNTNGKREGRDGSKESDEKEDGKNGEREENGKIILTGEYKRRYPRCIIIGVMKGGTYALRTFLTVHPRIVAYDGEIRYFNRNYIKGSIWYRSQMPKSYGNQITLEKSLYYGTSKTPKRIKALNKNMKLLLIVRDPVERAVSHFTHMKKEGFIDEDTGFAEMILDDNGDIRPGSKIVKAGVYIQHLRKWIVNFSWKNFHIVDGDSFMEDPIPELKGVQDFLDIEQKITKKNVYFDKKKRFYCFKKGDQKICLPSGKGRKHYAVKDSVLEKLRNFYHPYNVIFFKRTERKFQWKSEDMWYKEHPDATFDSEVERLSELHKAKLTERKPSVSGPKEKGADKDTEDDEDQEYDEELEDYDEEDLDEQSDEATEISDEKQSIVNIHDENM